MACLLVKIWKAVVLAFSLLTRWYGQHWIGRRGSSAWTPRRDEVSDVLRPNFFSRDASIEPAGVSVAPIHGGHRQRYIFVTFISAEYLINLRQINNHLTWEI
ncbi:hypothetical protein C0J52_10800 [Blattella germanica]|nr:hypothetical protein C0J52_10800 [Blattella germanica]